jgi:hypothetical protein
MHLDDQHAERGPVTGPTDEARGDIQYQKCEVRSPRPQVGTIVRAHLAVQRALHGANSAVRIGVRVYFEAGGYRTHVL